MKSDTLPIPRTDAKKNLPEGWVWKKVSDLGEVLTGTTPTKEKKEYYDSKDYPFFKPTDLNEGYYVKKSGDGLSKKGIEEARLLPSKSILVTCIGATIGKTGLIRVSGAFNQQINAIIPQKNVLPEFVYFVCISPQFQKSIVDNSSATTLPILNKRKFEMLTMPIPPLIEQQKIVEEIEKQFSRLDEAVAALKRVRASLKRYKASVLKAAVEGKLTEEWRKENPNVEPAEKLLKRILAERKKKWEEKNPSKKYKEPVSPDTSNLHELPKGWVWATLESVSDALGGYAFESKKFSISGYQIIKMANVKMSKINLSQQPSFISEVKPDIVEKYSLNTGDVIVTLTGTRKKRDYGYVAVVHSNAKILLNQRLARLRPYKGLIPKYLEIAMQSEVYRNRFFSYETGNVGQGNVGMGTVTKEPIAFPPYQEQQKIVEEIESRLSVAEEIEETIDINLKRAERLRQAILKKAFSGRLVEANN